MTTHSQQADRKNLRQTLRKSRRQLSKKQQHRHARQLSKNLNLIRHYRQTRHIGFYLAEDGEISAEAAIHKAWRQNKKVYLPILSPYADALFFAPYTARTKMIRNRFGILEPAVPLNQCKRAHQLQLICMPLVGFDSACNRLGMGGGFYDRSLHFRQHQKSWRHPKLLGLAHECQKVISVPTEAWDIPVDAVLTEQRCYKR